MFAAIHLPDSYLQALFRTRPEIRHQPVAVLDEGAKTSTKQDRGKARVLQCSAEATEFGVHIGMTATQAQARCEYLVLLNRSPVAEKQLQGDLFACADRLSPDYEATDDGLCTVDVGGVDHLRDRSRAHSLGREIVARLEEKQLHARIGLADNPELACLAARALDFAGGIASGPHPRHTGGAGDHSRHHPSCDDSDLFPVLNESPASAYSAGPSPPFPESTGSSRVLVILPGEEISLDPLPLAVLNLSPEWRDLFQLWGIQTLRQLKQLDRAELIERLGSEAGLIHDRAAGRADRLLRLVRPVPLFEAQWDLDYEVDSLEPLLFVARRLLETLAARLRASYLVAAGVLLRLDYRNGNHYRRRFRIPDPCVDVDMLLSLLHTHLEDFEAEDSISGLRLRVFPARGGRHQFDLFVAGLKDPNQLAETLARLDAILGSGRVGSPALLPTHRPDAFEILPFCPGQVEKDVGGRPAPAVPLLMGLPMRRLRPRLQVEIRCRGRPFDQDHDSRGSPPRSNPVAILSGPFRGNITAAFGPWRISGTWWEKALLWRREEWDVALEDGGICRLSRDRKEWFVEGVYG